MLKRKIKQDFNSNFKGYISIKWEQGFPMLLWSIGKINIRRKI